MREFKRLIDEGSLWIMVAAPSVWAAHFLLCYWLAAVWCAKIGGGLATVQTVTLALTAVALAIVGWLSWKARREYDGRLTVKDDHDGNTDETRRRFLGHATLLLAVLSAIAIVVDALPALVFDRC